MFESSFEFGEQNVFVERFMAYIKRYPLRIFIAVISFLGVILYFGSRAVSEKDSSVLVATRQVSDDVSTVPLPDNPAEVYVDISGAVTLPGVYKLENGSRVIDALKQAGPLTSEASSTWVSQNLNLSERVYDTQKIYVPFEWDFDESRQYVLSVDIVKNLTAVQGISVEKSSERISSPTITKDSSATTNSSVPVADASGTSINVNTAVQSELESLYGIGKAYAQRIIENRPYDNLAELIEKTKIPKSTIEKIQENISF
jgi:competence protein ComEA